MAKRRNLRQTVIDLAEEFEALLVFTHQMNGERMTATVRLKRKIPQASKSKLRIIQKHVGDDISNIREEFGIHASRHDLILFYESIKAAAKAGNIVYASKNAITSRMAKNYGHRLPSFENFPEHTRLGFALAHQRNKMGGIDVDVALLEKTLYEDMCQLSNLAIKNGSGGRKRLSPRAKELVDTLERATIRAAFAFLEGYISGVAQDHILQTTTRLPMKAKRLLLEAERDKLRERIARCQRIILGVKEAPVNVGNCEELGYLLKEIKGFRDAFTHPSPSVGFIPKGYDIRRSGRITKDEIVSKEEMFLIPDLYDVHRIVDSSITVVRKLQAAFYKDREPPTWLVDRDEDRMFRYPKYF